MFKKVLLFTSFIVFSLSCSFQTPTIAPVPTPTLTATLTPFPTSTLTPTPTPTYTPSPISCFATTGAEYIISGGVNPQAGIFVDDILRVFVNTKLVTEVSQSGRCCPPAPAIHFTADSGDTLRVQAQDANACYSLETLWLQKADGSCRSQLTKGISGPNCNSEPPKQIFFDQTFTLP